MKVIRLGLKDNLDVSLYAKPEFDDKKMEQIRYALENNLNVSIFMK